MSKQTLVVFVLDETGSMLSCMNATISGFNEYVAGLKKDGGKTKFTLTKFNSDKVETVHDAVKVKDIPALSGENYSPAATTPLYDAIGRTVRATEKSLNGKKKTPSVLFVVMTDGFENSSKEFTREGIYDLIKQKENEGWTFVYLGADQDAWALSQQIGFAQGNTISYDSAKTAQTFGALSDATASYRKAGSRQTDEFWKENSPVTHS